MPDNIDRRRAWERRKRASEREAPAHFNTYHDYIWGRGTGGRVCQRPEFRG
jgi:hypothetical protein